MKVAVRHPAAGLLVMLLLTVLLLLSHLFLVNNAQMQWM